MAHHIIGHGYSSDEIKRAQRDYIQAWLWRAAHQAEFRSLLLLANAKAAQGERINVRQLIAGTAPQRFAPLVARWLAHEQPGLLPFIETRRSVFDLLTG